MKGNKVYWISTILLISFTMLSGISQLISSNNSAQIMGVLKLPLYLLPFLGAAKILGGIAILLPNLNRLKEWAYAGLMFDFIGALFAMIAVGGTFDKWSFMSIPILLCSASYYYFHKRQQANLAN